MHHGIQEQFTESRQGIFINFSSLNLAGDFKGNFQVGENKLHWLFHHLKKRAANHPIIDDSRCRLEAADMQSIGRIVPAEQQHCRMRGPTIFQIAQFPQYCLPFPDYSEAATFCNPLKEHLDLVPIQVIERWIHVHVGIPGKLQGLQMEIGDFCEG